MSAPTAQAKHSIAFTLAAFPEDSIPRLVRNRRPRFLVIERGILLGRVTRHAGVPRPLFVPAIT